MADSYLPDMIQARALMGFYDLVAEAGVDPLPLLDDCAIDRKALHEPELPVSLDNLARLYDHAARVLGWQDFGLRLAERQDLSLYGPLALVAMHAPTLGEALNGLVRYFPYHTPGGHIEIEPAADVVRVHYALRLGEGVPALQIIEQSYAMAARIWRFLAPPAAPSPQLQLSHAPLSALADYQRAFGCEVEFNQPHDAILLPAAALALPLDRADGRLRQASEEFIAGIIRRSPLDIGRQVETLIISQLALGCAGIDAIAGQLRMHRRTLQRRLAAQGLVFEHLLDDIRRRQAQQYLTQTGLPPAEAGALLGYGEQSSFIRACRRWFGGTPLQVRRRLLQSDGGLHTDNNGDKPSDTISQQEERWLQRR